MVLQLFRKENTMRRIAVTLFCITLLFAASGLAHAGGQAAPLSTPDLKKIITAGKKTVVFFLNPNGGPCRAQDEVLVKLRKDKKNNFSIAYVSAMVDANQKAFYDYGVRSLPTLVIVDSSGKLGHFFAPGIQSYETLAAALDQVK
jgi:thioredoxin 1